MQYNYETQNDLLSIIKINFYVSDINNKINIENDKLKCNKPDPLTGYIKSYYSDITNQDIENFKYLFNLESIEITLNEREINDKHKELINIIMDYFKDIGPIETIIYNTYNEIVDNFNIGSVANIKFDKNIQEYVYNKYNTKIYDINEFAAFLNSIKFNHKHSGELCDYRYAKLLEYINKLEERIKVLEEKK